MEDLKLMLGRWHTKVVLQILILYVYNVDMWIKF